MLSLLVAFVSEPSPYSVLTLTDTYVNGKEKKRIVGDYILSIVCANNTIQPVESYRYDVIWLKIWHLKLIQDHLIVSKYYVDVIRTIV